MAKEKWKPFAALLITNVVAIATLAYWGYANLTSKAATTITDKAVLLVQEKTAIIDAEAEATSKALEAQMTTVTDHAATLLKNLGLRENELLDITINLRETGPLNYLPFCIE